VGGDSHLSVKEALRQLFGIESYSRIPKLRNSINTLFRALKKGHILDEANVPIEFTSSESEHWYLLRKDLVAFHNAVILHGIYSEPKVVIKIFQNVDERKELAVWARDILINRQSVASVGLIRHQLTQFLDQLDSQSDLHQKRLTNPFDNALPQMGFGPHGNLLKVLAAQTAVLSFGDSMMVRFLDGDLEGAAKAARELSTTEPLLSRYKTMILSEFREAAEFDDLLDEWRK
jgi:hypothetical protein